MRTPVQALRKINQPNTDSLLVQVTVQVEPVLNLDGTCHHTPTNASFHQHVETPVRVLNPDCSKRLESRSTGRRTLAAARSWQLGSWQSPLQQITIAADVFLALYNNATPVTSPRQHFLEQIIVSIVVLSRGHWGSRHDGVGLLTYLVSRGHLLKLDVFCMPATPSWMSLQCAAGFLAQR